MSTTCPICGTQTSGWLMDIQKHALEQHGRNLTRAEERWIARIATSPENATPYTESDNQGRAYFEVSGGAICSNRRRY